MSSESGRRLSTEELKRLNQSSKAAPPPMVLLREADWKELLDRLEASAAAQETLLRALSQQAGQCPTQAQMEALTRDVAEVQRLLQQAGKKKEFSISPPSLGTAMSVVVWLALILLGTMVAMVVLQVIWSGLAALWSVIKLLIP